MIVELPDGRKRRGNFPGSIVDNKGHWWWLVKLPGAEKRRGIPLKLPGCKHAMPSTLPREEAARAAFREWERIAGVAAGEPDGRTVNELCDAWCVHAREYYKGSNEADNARVAVRQFRLLHGTRPLAELEHRDMVAVRDAVARTGVARVTVNRYMNIIRRMLAWALDDGLIRARVKAELSQVSPLKRGRTSCRECEPIRSVPPDALEATVAALPPNTADMVRVHELTGMRPGEVCAMRWADIDTACEPWVYRPQHHKNEWRDKPRVVLLGPKARAILSRHKGATGAIFSPSRALAELFELQRAAAQTPRKTPLDKAHAARMADAWNTQSYGHTVRYACARANVEIWSPNQLRHLFATRVRRRFGITAARFVLGHSLGSGTVTDRYSFEAAEEEFIRGATEAVEALG